MGQDSGLAGSETPLPSELSALQSALSETRRRLAEAEQALSERHAGEVNPPHGAGTAHDIGVQKRTPAAALPEHHFSAQFEQSAVGMAQLSAITGRYAGANKAFCDLVGYSMDEIVNLTPGDITFDDDREVDAGSVAALLRGETDSYDVEKRYVRKDGGLIWVHVNAMLLRDAQGGPERSFAIIEDISDRKATEKALRQSEARFKAAFHNSSLAMSIVSQTKSAYVDVNKACIDLFGLSREAMIGRSPAELELYDDPTTTRAALRSLLVRDGFVRDHEVLWRARDGQLRWHLLSADPVVLEGEPCLFVVSHDITDRKLTEARLRQSEEFNRTLLESTPDCLKVIDAEGRLEFVNENGACLLELDDRAVVLGEPWETLWPASQHSAIRQAIAAALAGSEVRFTAAAPAAKGTPKIWEVAVAPVLGADGQPTKLIAVSRDVTELRRGVEQLRESEARFRAAVEAVDGIVWTNNAVGEMAGEQPGWSALTGQTPAEYEGFGWSQAVHPDDAQPTIEAWNAAVAARGLFEFEHRVRRQDGEWRHFSIRAAPTLDGEDRIVEWVGVHRDITERKNREARIQLLMGEVNHRSKNMLAVVMAVARQTSGADLAEFMHRFSDRLQSLADGQDLLVKSQWKGVPIDELVRAQLGHFKDLIGGRITLAGGAVNVSPSAAQTIGMALHELATNASKHGALSTARGRVAIAWQLVDGIAPARRFVMTWTESDGPAVVAPKRHGFGSTVIGKMVKMSFDGDVTTEFARSGFLWRIDCPAENVVEEMLSDVFANAEVAHELTHSGG